MSYFAQMEKDLFIMACALTISEMQMWMMTFICLLGGECTCKAKQGKLSPVTYKEGTWRIMDFLLQVIDK
jgi:hypothetical protein